MPEMSPGAALRELQQAQAGLKKARALLKQARENSRLLPEGISKLAGRACRRHIA